MVRRLTLVLFVLGTWLTIAPAGAQSMDCLPDTLCLAWGQAQMQAGAYSEALARFTCAFESDPESEATHVGRLEASLLAGDYLTAYGEAFLLGDGHPTALDNAIAAQSDILTTRPDDMQALRLRAFLNLFAGRGSAALADAQAALERQPDDVLAHVISAGAYAMMGDADASVTAFEAAISLAPNNAQVYGLMAAVQFLVFDVEGMANNSARAIELGPELVHPYRLQGVTQLIMGNPDSAMASASQAIELDPTYYGYYILRANAKLASGDALSALADLNQAIELNPCTSIGHGQRANVLLAQGDTRSAAVDFETAIRVGTVEVVGLTELVEDESVIVSMTAGRTFRLPFEGAAGQVVTFRVTSANPGQVDPLLLVVGPDGKLLIFNDDESGESMDALLENYLISADGRYIVVVSHARGGSEGDIRITIEFE